MKTKRGEYGAGSLLKLKHCRFWYAQYYDGQGRQVRVSTKKESKMEAAAELRKLLAKRDMGEASPLDMRRVTYGQLRRALLDSYTERGNRTLEQRADGTETIVGLPQLDQFFGYVVGDDNSGWPLNRITTDAAREFVRQRQAQDAGPAMINRSLACLRRMLRIAHEDGKLQTVPKIRLLKEPPPRRGFLEQEKFNELLALLPGHLRPLILFLYWTAVRVGEARKIEWSQVNLDARLITLHDTQTKNAEPRIIPLPGVLVSLLAEMEPKTGLVFDDTNLRVEWETACSLCGLGTREIVTSPAGNKFARYRGLIVHDLRRSAVRNLRLAGITETEAMKISGHKTRDVFTRYNIISTDDISAAMRRVEVWAATNGNGKLINGAALDSVKLVKQPKRPARKTLQLAESTHVGA